MLPDFVLLPPEVNSAHIYAGPRSGSMWAAAAAWDGLAAALESAASSFESTVSGLTGGAWQGPTPRTRPPSTRCNTTRCPTSHSTRCGCRRTSTLCSGS